MAEGGSAEVFEWGCDCVLKLFRPKYAYAVEMEASRARAVQAVGVRCPAVVERVTVEDRPGIVFERVKHDSLLDRLVGDRAIPGAHRRHA